MLSCDLHDNLLRGTIPTDIGDMSDLVEIRLMNNNLTGVVPDSITSLSALTAAYLCPNGGLTASASAATFMTDLPLNNWMDGC